MAGSKPVRIVLDGKLVSWAFESVEDAIESAYWIAQYAHSTPGRDLDVFCGEEVVAKFRIRSRADVRRLA